MLTPIRILSVIALFLAGAGAAVADDATPGMCTGPGGGGGMCMLPDAASLARGDGINVGAGNPMNIISGNKYQIETDLPALPGVLGLEIVRTYNSQFSKPGNSNGIVGRGWRLGYESELRDNGAVLQILQADGARLIFNADPANPSLCASTDPAHGRVEVRKSAAGTAYLWRWTNGRTVHFNAQGKVSHISAPTGETLVLGYTAGGLLRSVTDPQGRTMRLNYAARGQGGDTFGGVESIDTPVGRFSYAYGSSMPAGATVAPIHLLANLVGVTLPGALTRRYHYEDPRHPTLLTGISAGSATQRLERIGTYLYDSDGKGLLTVRGEPARLLRGADGKVLQPPRLAPGTGVEQVVFERGVAGQTTISNSLGQKTVYRHALVGGVNALLEVRGPGCATCGETDVRYSYDGQGRLMATLRLTRDGIARDSESVERDALGRVTQSNRTDYRNGVAGPARWLRRYGYTGAASEPDWVARPSRFEGREIRTTYVWNDKGQLLRETESGWAPGGAGAPVPLTRTNTYEYSLINGRSLLTRVDGPLANGRRGDPADSDVTQLFYDQNGNFLTRMLAPGNINTSYGELDAGGRAGLVEISDGVNPAVQTRSSYNPQGQVLQVARLLHPPAPVAASWWRGLAARFTPSAAAGGALVTMVDYDAQSRPRRLTRPDGTRLELVRDGPGEGARLQDQEGNAVTRVLDTENRLLSISANSAAASTPVALGKYYEYDDDNRVSAMRTANGAQTRYAYDPVSGQLVGSTDALERRTRMAYDADGELAEFALGDAGPQAAPAVTLWRQARDKAGDVIRTANGAATRYRRDDFGRALEIVSADSGNRAMQYDAANRITVIVDGNGNRSSFAYNAAGAVTERVTVGKAGTERVSYRYQGMRLRAMVSAQESSEYAYDQNGMLVEQIDTIVPVGGGAPLRFVRRHGYDSLGRPSTHILASGETLVIAYNQAGRAHSMTLTSADGKTTQPLLSDIAVNPLLGLTGFTHGNGLHTSYGRNRRTALLTQLTVAPRPQRATATAAGPWEWLPSTHAAPAGAPLYVEQLDYDQAGRVTAIATSGRSQETAAQAYYGYDRFDRLRQADVAGSALQWRYDAAGNRLAQAGAAPGGARQSLKYQVASNRLVALETGAGPQAEQRAYQYDAGGNPVRIGERTYAYGAGGRVQQVTLAAGASVRYAYNGDGERVAKTVEDGKGGSRTTYFLYHGQKIDAEIDGSGKLVAQYVYLDHTPVAKLEYSAAPGGAAATRVYAVHTDHLGTPQLATDAQQKIVWQARQTAFGEARVTVQAISLHLRLPGQYFDTETGTHYNYFRDYDPAIGRYLQSDPIGLAGGINAYAYAGGDPVSAFDPLGLLVWTNKTTYASDLSQSTWYAVIPGAQKFRPSSADTGANTLIDWGIKPRCMCMGGTTYKFVEFEVEFRSNVHMRANLTSTQIVKVKAAENDHIADFNAWANAKGMAIAQSAETGYKTFTFTSMKACQDTVVDSLDKRLQREPSLAQAVRDSLKKYDSPGGAHGH